MADPTIHEMAPHHLPAFIPGADGSDVLFSIVVVSGIGLILVIGALYFTLHSIPEKMAHRANSTQFQLIAILALLALFTHNNLFWVIALILATIEFPNFSAPLRSIADSLDKMQRREK